MLRLLGSPAVLRVSPSAQPVVLIELRYSQHIDQPVSQREPGIVSQLLTTTTTTTTVENSPHNTPSQQPSPRTTADTETL